MVRDKRGTSVIEVLVALSIGGVIIASVGNLITSIHRVDSTSNHSTQALGIARESLEAVAGLWAQNPSDVSCPSNPCATRYLQRTGSAWQLTGVNPSPDAPLQSSLLIENLYRSGGQIVTSGGTEDPATKRISATVTWTERSVTKQQTLSTVLTDWRH